MFLLKEVKQILYLFINYINFKINIIIENSVFYRIFVVKHNILDFEILHPEFFNDLYLFTKKK